jgi:hypothetical protein
MSNIEYTSNSIYSDFVDLCFIQRKKSKSDGTEKRREKKLFYASLVKEAKERETELAKKYRDRAKERREVVNKDTDTVPTNNTTANFKAVAPDIGL